MGDLVHLTAADGHRFTVYRATPIGKPKGGIVLLHEVYGINTHLRGLADAFADEGYKVLAPALFDRAEKGVEMNFSAKGAEIGCGLRNEIGWDAPLLDIETARQNLSDTGKIAVIGESYGGSLAWRAAAKLNFACAVCGSPGELQTFITELPKCPTQLHFAIHDIKTPAKLRATAKNIPNVETFEYDADHAFTCPQRPGYAASATRQVEAHTLSLLGTHLS